MKSKMRNDIWLKRAASLISIIYTVYICVLSYRSVFYDVIVTGKVSFCLYISAITAVSLAAMIYSRKQLATRLSGFILIPALLPVIFSCLGEWELIIPTAACAVVIFFASGANEASKTIIGTMYLLMYILAALAYFIFTSFLSSPSVKETIDSGVSPSGKYRYEIVNTVDSSNGSTSVILEPNDKDIEKKSVTYKAKGYDRTICVKRPLTKIKLEWKDDELYIDGERWFTPEQAKKEKWFDEKSFSFDFI
ncbi:MAG: hypothetical protein ACI4I9_08115 [Porcipelethomonas sp.]